MSIWYEKFTLEHVISLRNNNLNKHLGIEFIELGEDYIVARMPVEDFTRQSRGILHGGASCVLAEALGSIASNMCIDMRKQKAVGLEINANHVDPLIKFADLNVLRRALNYISLEGTSLVASPDLRHKISRIYAN